ncbi:hypothetical protein ACIPRI_06145 [Variovorax sp. LARHSF232]
MHPRAFPLLLAASLFLLGQHAAQADDDDMRPRGSKRWWRGELPADPWGGPCDVKTDSKRGEYKREIKCKDGIGAAWRGEWKTEFRDGPCLVKQEAKRDEFKEEIKCEGR